MSCTYLSFAGFDLKPSHLQYVAFFVLFKLDRHNTTRLLELYMNLHDCQYHEDHITPPPPTPPNQLDTTVVYKTKLNKIEAGN